MSKNTLNPELVTKFDYQDPDFLETFMTDQKKILSRRSTHLSVSQHRKLTKTIKQSRIAGLIPFIIKESE
jgi:small subunit ribosomal protein S18|tara:strand:- start:16865 stop:17074 length:210 start_codon:yes stop_codon:yes gene_type:complete